MSSRRVSKKKTRAPVAPVRVTDVNIAKIPPSLGSATLVQSLTFRYVSTSATTGSNIFWTCLSKLLWRCATTTTGNSSLAAISLRKVEMYAPYVAATTSTIQITQENTDEQLFKSRLVSDTTSSNTGAYCCMKWRKNDPFRAYHDAGYAYGGQVAFNLVCPVGTTVDLKVVFFYTSQGSALACIGGTPGKEYFNALDNTASGGGAGNGWFAPVPYAGYASYIIAH